MRFIEVNDRGSVLFTQGGLTNSSEHSEIDEIYATPPPIPSQCAPPLPPQYQTANIYFQQSLQAGKKTKYKGNFGVETKTDPKTGTS